MFKLKQVNIVVLAVLMLVLMVGCQSNQNNSVVETTEVVKETELVKETEEVVEVVDVRVIEHAMGTTEIQGTPLRVVTLYQGAADVALALGVKPVGIVESWVQKPLYNYLRADLGDTPIVGLETQPNLEEIAKLNPDLIIASKIRHEKIYDQLSQIAPTVTHETVFKFKETVELMGLALNKVEESENLLADWDERVADFKVKAQAKFGDEWPISISVLNFRTDHARIYVSGFAGDILTELGFTRPDSQRIAAEEGNVVVKLTTKESIPSMNADIFFTFVADGHNSDAEAIQRTFDEWTGHPLWANLDAVKANRAYIVDEVAWNMAGGYTSALEMLDQIYDRFELEK